MADTNQAEETTDEPTRPQPVTHPPDPETGAIRVTLGTPVERKGRPDVTDVTIRRARGKDIRATAGMNSEARTYELAIRCGGLMPDVFDAMDCDDVVAIAAVVDGFF